GDVLWFCCFYTLVDMHWLERARRSCTERAQIDQAMRALLPFFRCAGLASGPGSELAPACAVGFDLGEFALQALAPSGVLVGRLCDLEVVLLQRQNSVVIELALHLQPFHFRLQPLHLRFYPFQRLARLLQLAFEFADPLGSFSGSLDQRAVLDFQHRGSPAE